MLDSNLKDAFYLEIKEEYKELREDYLATQKEKKFKTLEVARKNKLILDWALYKAPKPKAKGITVIDQPIQDLIQYIDWNPFFSVWQVRGRYPTRSYPKIFDDPTAGQQPKTLFSEAQALLKEICEITITKPSNYEVFRRFKSLFPKVVNTTKQ